MLSALGTRFELVMALMIGVMGASAVGAPITPNTADGAVPVALSATVNAGALAQYSSWDYDQGPTQARAESMYESEPGFFLSAVADISWSPMGVGFEVASDLSLERWSDDGGECHAETWIDDGVISVGTLDDGAIGVPVTLHYELTAAGVNGSDPQYGGVSFEVRRDADAIASASTVVGTETGSVGVFTGESLNLGFSDSYYMDLAGWGSVGRQCSLSMWVVPEPASIVLMVLILFPVVHRQIRSVN